MNTAPLAPLPASSLTPAELVALLIPVAARAATHLVAMQGSSFEVVAQRDLDTISSWLVEAQRRVDAA